VAILQFPQYDSIRIFCHAEEKILQQIRLHMKRDVKLQLTDVYYVPSCVSRSTNALQPVFCVCKHNTHLLYVWTGQNIKYSPLPRRTAHVFVVVCLSELPNGYAWNFQGRLERFRRTKVPSGCEHWHRILSTSPQKGNPLKCDVPKTPKWLICTPGYNREGGTLNRRCERVGGRRN